MERPHSLCRTFHLFHPIREAKRDFYANLAAKAADAAKRPTRKSL
jgi:hypothetical protein